MLKTTTQVLILSIFTILQLTAQVNFVPQSLFTSSGTNMIIADLNGDGLDDIINDNSWHQNVGNNLFIEIPLITAGIFDIADMDGDGDIDLIGRSSDNAAEANWFENDGSGNFTPHFVGRIFGFISEELRDFYAEDMDGDGDIDIVTAGTISYPQGSMEVFEHRIDIWEKQGPNFVERSLDPGFNITVADFDGDGDMDVVSRNTVSNIFIGTVNSIELQENLGNNNFSSTNITAVMNGPLGSKLHAADVNYDGKMDFLTNGFSWYENVGSGFLKNDLQSGGVFDINSADVDGDGNIDILTAGDELSWWKYENGMLTKNIIGTDFSFNVVGTDLDGDGDTDVLATALNEVIFWENDTPVIGNCVENIAGFTFLGEFNNHNYFLSENIFTGSGASMEAAANGGYLASMDSEFENDFLFGNIGTDIVHIGFSDAAAEGSFTWDSGEGVSYNKVDGSNSADNDYGVMNFWDGSWTMVNQWVQKKFILEIPCGPVTPSLTVNCPADITLGVPVGEFGAIIDFEDPTFTQNCGIVDISQFNGLASGSFFPVGTTLNVFQITLTCGSETVNENCSFTVTVEEIEANCGSDDIPGFTFWGEYNDHKYFLSDDIQTSEAAQSIAFSNGGYLASIDDQGENDFLQNQLGFNIVHIGFNDADAEGAYAWASGDPVGFNNHDGGNSADNDFGVINFWDGSWTLVNMWVQKQFIMEIPCDPIIIINNDPAGNVSTNENPGKPGDKFHGLGMIKKVFPNPAEREVTLSLQSPEDQVTQVEVFDAFGKRVYFERADLYKGDNQLTIDIRQFMAGIFTVKIGNGKGKTSVSRFVKIVD